MQVSPRTSETEATQRDRRCSERHRGKPRSEGAGTASRQAPERSQPRQCLQPPAQDTHSFPGKARCTDAMMTMALRGRTAGEPARARQGTQPSAYLPLHPDHAADLGAVLQRDSLGRPGQVLEAPDVDLAVPRAGDPQLLLLKGRARCRWLRRQHAHMPAHAPRGTSGSSSKSRKEVFIS